MIQKKNKLKIIFLKKMIQKKNKLKIISSIVQNSEIKNYQRQIFIIKKTENISLKEKKTCLFGISNKYIENKSKFSRFALNKIVNNNLNQNFNKYEK